MSAMTIPSSFSYQSSLPAALGFQPGVLSRQIAGETSPEPLGETNTSGTKPELALRPEDGQQALDSPLEPIHLQPVGDDGHSLLHRGYQLCLMRSTVYSPQQSHHH